MATESRGLRLKPPEALRLKAGSRLGRRGDLETLSVLVPSLVLDIFADRLFIDRAHRRAEISSCPKVLPPVTLAKVRELVLQHPARPTLQILHQLRRRQLRRNLHQQMDMIRRHRTTHDRHLPRRADLTDQLPGTLRHLAAQYLVPILRDPHNVILHVPHRVAARSILSHLLQNLARMLKAHRLKAVGLNQVHGTKRIANPSYYRKLSEVLARPFSFFYSHGKAPAKLVHSPGRHETH